jgi:hypothetical protein
MAKYDLESLLADIKALMLANLNNKITEINTEKNDSIVLAPVDADAYFLQQMNGRQMNWPVGIVYGVDDIQSGNRGPLSNSKFQLSAIIIVTDTGEDIEIGTRMFRYSRALEEIFRENWTKGNNAVKLEISSLVPIPLTNLNSSEQYRAVGLQIDASLAG